MEDSIADMHMRCPMKIIFNFTLISQTQYTFAHYTLFGVLMGPYLIRNSNPDKFAALNLNKNKPNN